MNKNKMYRYYKDIYTEKQIKHILDGGSIANVWEEKEKRVKKTWNNNKKKYNNSNILGCKKRKMKSYKFTRGLDEAIMEKSYETDVPVKKMFANAGLSTNTYYVIKKRWVISPRSLYKIKKIVPDFNFSELENDNPID